MQAPLSASTRSVAAGLLAGNGILHLILAPEYASEQAYVGVLFALGGLALLALAYVVRRFDDARAWAAGALTMAAMGAGFILSRTTGLPGFHESEWELSGLISLLLEGAFVALAVRRLGGYRAMRAVGP
jgi:hypothetical protein